MRSSYNINQDLTYRVYSHLIKEKTLMLYIEVSSQSYLTLAPLPAAGERTLSIEYRRVGIHVNEREIIVARDL